MSSSLFVINNHPYHDTSSSSSSLDISQEEHDLSNRNQRVFILDKKKDLIRWSHVKQTMNDLVLETKLTKLTNENEVLRAKIDMLMRKFGHLSGQENEQTTVLNTLDQSLTQSDKHSSVTTKINLQYQ